MKVAKSVLVMLGFAMFSQAPFPHLVPTARAQEQSWIVQFGTSGSDNGHAITTDSAGGMFVLGSTRGDLGAPNTGRPDVFLARYDSAGNQVWMRQFGSGETDYGRAIAPDGAGGVMIAGRTGGDLAGPHAGGAWDLFMARYDSTGARLWILQFGSTSGDYLEALMPDGAGGVFVGGTAGGDLGGPIPDPGPFLARFDENGQRLWIQQFGGSEGGAVDALAPDGAGGVFVAGDTSGSLGGPNAGNPDVFLARFDGAGNQIWISQFGSSEHDRANALAPDGTGGVIVGGDTNGTLGGPGAGAEDAFVARHDGAGNQLWLRKFGTSEFDSVSALVPNGTEGVTVLGHTWGDVGGPNAGELDVFLMGMSSAGNQRWARQFGTSARDAVWAAAPDDAGGVVLTGYTQGSLSGPNAGENDVLLARYEIDFCYADCDQSTGNGVLDVFDFLCFQNSFVNSEPYACDCDTSTGPGVCDVFDFLCFQDAFVGGCP